MTLPRVCWSGGRDHGNLAQCWQAVNASEPHVMVVGGARGVDAVAEDAQRQRGGAVDLHAVSDEEWKCIGPKAGHDRNARMAESGISRLEAFPWGEARGTRDMIEACEKRGIPVNVHEPGDPSLLIQSARITYTGRDGYNVTRKTGKGDALTFAPSWKIVKPIVDQRKQHERLIEQNGGIADPTLRAYIEEAEQRAWLDYVPKYLDEMRKSWQVNRAAWDWALAQPRLVCLCYCSHPAHCHRHLLRAMFVKAGAKIGRRVFDGGDLNYADRS